MTTALHRELWISWSSMLRVYAAAHGLHSNRFAVIEFGDDLIVMRVDARWVRFTRNEMETSEGKRAVFALNEDGAVMLDGKIEEMDMAAERVARELLG